MSVTVSELLLEHQEKWEKYRKLDNEQDELELALGRIRRPRMNCTIFSSGSGSRVVHEPYELTLELAKDIKQFRATELKINEKIAERKDLLTDMKTIAEKVIDLVWMEELRIDYFNFLVAINRH